MIKLLKVLKVAGSPVESNFVLSTAVESSPAQSSFIVKVAGSPVQSSFVSYG